MVRANCANTTPKILPLFHPIRQPTLPSRGRRNGLPAGSRASGGHAGRGRQGGRGRRGARLRRGSPDGAAALRSRVARKAIDRARIPANRDGAGAPPTARQRPASSRTTRKDFW
jgi:hypothetical protein